MRDITISGDSHEVNTQMRWALAGEVTTQMERVEISS